MIPLSQGLKYVGLMSVDVLIDRLACLSVAIHLTMKIYSVA